MMHKDMQKYEEEIEGCKEARSWMDAPNRKGSIGTQWSLVRTSVHVDIVLASASSTWGIRSAAKEAIEQILFERWPELALAIRAILDKREAAAREGRRELANKILAEVE